MIKTGPGFKAGRILCIALVWTCLASAGRSAEDMVKADLLKAYKAEYSHVDRLGLDCWIRTVGGGLQTVGR
jgi:hypothetical protein